MAKQTAECLCWWASWWKASCKMTSGYLRKCGDVATPRCETGVNVADLSVLTASPQRSVCGLTQCLLPAGHQSCQADCCSVLVSCIQILCVQPASRSSYHRLQITWECCSSPGFLKFFLWTVYILFVQFKNETFAPTTLNKVTGVRLL